MANGPTEKQFQELIEAQKKTNQLLLSDHDTKMEHDQQLALEESAEREETEKKREKSDEKTRSLLNKLTLGMLGTGGSAKKEEEEKGEAGEKKQIKLFTQIAGGISFIGDKMMDTGRKAGKGLMAMVKGTLFAGILIAIVAFLNSDIWKEMKVYIAENLVPMMEDFWENTLKPFGLKLIKFFKDPTWENFTNMFGDGEGSMSSGITMITLALAGIAFAKVATFAWDLGTAVVDIGKKINNKILKPMKDAIGNFASKTWKGITNLTSGIATSISNLGTNINKNVLQPLKTAITNAAATAWQFLVTIGTKITALGAAMKAQILVPIKTAIENAAATAWQFLVTIGQKITALAVAMKAQILVPIKTAIENAAASAWTFLVTIGTKITALGAAMKAQILVPIQTAITNAAATAWTFLVTIGTKITALAVALNANVLVPLQAAVAATAAKLWTAIKLIPPAIAALQLFFIGTLGPMLAAALVPLAPFIAVAAVVVAAAVAIGFTLYALYKAFQDFRCTLEETGSIGEALKVGVSKFMAFLIGWPAALMLKLVGWVAGIFGFDEFKEKVQDIDPIQFIADKIKGMFDLIFEWIGKLFDIDWKGLITDLIPDFVKDSALGRLLGFETPEKTPEEKAEIAAEAERSQQISDETIVGGGQHGGPLLAGQSYLVGEAGMERFTPSQSGHLMNAQRTAAMMNSALQRRMDGMGGMGGGGSAIIAPTTVANTNSTNITHTTTSLINPDLVVSTVNKAA